MRKMLYHAYRGKGSHTPLWLKIQKEEIQMRNLKRALSLALAAIMLVGMMVVSASAASYNNLTDKDEIVNKDAVSMLVSLGIIEGKPDGSYAPTENVDRAQMAKMLSVIMNKGVDNSALYQSVNSGLTISPATGPRATSTTATPPASLPAAAPAPLIPAPP